jgi:hypothetical protein
MKLSAVYIKNVRSVKDAGIEDIDNFNVVIGKVNSGKSNILSGMSRQEYKIKCATLQYLHEASLTFAYIDVAGMQTIFRLQFFIDTPSTQFLLHEIGDLLREAGQK